MIHPAPLAVVLSVLQRMLVDVANTQAGGRKLRARAIGVSIEFLCEQESLGLKWCRSCSGWKSINEFALDRSRNDGHKHTCFQCNKKRVGPTSAERRVKKAMGLFWCIRCFDWRSGKRAGLCQAHQNEYARENYARDGSKIRARVRCRTRRLNEPIPPWFAQLERDLLGGRCAYGCGRPGVTNDHVIPVEKGGDNRPWNIVPACQTCNSRKWAHDPGPWIEKGLNSDYASDYWLEKIALKEMSSDGENYSDFLGF